MHTGNKTNFPNWMKKAVLCRKNTGKNAFILTTMEFYRAIDQGKQGMISTNTNIGASFYYSPALSNQDIACEDKLTI